jgi:hypothetical protein
MATGADVLNMLIPSGGWVIYGNDFDSIIYDQGVSPITKKQYDDGLKAYDAFKAKQDADKAANKAAILDRLGITAEEATLLLG